MKSESFLKIKIEISTWLKIEVPTKCEGMHVCISKKLAAAASSSLFVKIPYLPEEHLVESA